MRGENEQALAELLRASQPSPNNLRWRAVAYVELGRLDEARGAIREILKVNPRLTIASLRAMLPFRSRMDLERHLANLRRAGLPEA